MAAPEPGHGEALRPEALRLRGVSVELGGRRVVDDVSLDVPAGAFVALLGPNGSGKTTLLRALYRGVARATGEVHVGGVSIDALAPRALAQRMAVVHQDAAIEFDFRVDEVVAMGRAPHQGWLARGSADDRRAVAEALEATDTVHLASRSFARLSGGERQRVLLARAWAQRPRVLLLDEPTNHLDVRHQLDFLARVAKHGATVVAALHDPALALRFAAQAVLLTGGRVRAAGPVSDVLTPPLLAEVLDVDVEAARASSGTTAFVFHPRRAPLGG